ncbi:S41 family peptidase [Sanyastnella coralliicola]|uniref:S41 family peptidase n=1 Tax=Sanyastnella coralliicola TaxID=3069118 RepID=UPI0027BB20AE|nr:S41 family peptidase [Longitalea sp. SCSIO 12813]
MSERINDIMNEEPKRGRSAFQPLIYAILVVLGVYIGSNFSGNSTFTHRPAASENPNKLVNIINKIDEMYVDSVEKKALIEKAINAMLEDLDPHSYYISSEELASVQEPLQGNFEGIGVEFMIQKDTLVVVSPIQGGPSETAGIRAGDRIVEVDGEHIAGIGLTNSKVMEVLKGEKGTKVDLKIQRRGTDDILDFNITRDRIPIYSVVASTMVEPGVGYIKLTRFAKNSYEEFMMGMAKLDEAGAESIIFDLRGNGGGYLHVAIPMVEEFLEDDKLIVYTEGVNSPRSEYRSQRRGRYADKDVVILINSGSASASEIMAGALQDHDRSITVGRRSFGKGLVQDEIPLPDESALRLTVARYYTPTGRSIQRPYGEEIDYDNDYNDRYDSGELYSEEKIELNDSLKFTTPKGRIVYGGGGITPDVFVPIDTIGASWYFSDLSYAGTIRRYGFDYSDSHRDELSSYSDVESFLKGFKVTNVMMEGLFKAGEEDGYERDERAIAESGEVMKIRLKAHMAKNLFGDEAYYRALLEDDNVYDAALEVARNYKDYAIVDGELTLLSATEVEEAMTTN